MGAASLALIGCGGDEHESNTPEVATTFEGKPQRGGRYTTTFSTLTNWNTVSDSTNGAKLAGVSIYDRLMTTRLDTKRYPAGYNLEAVESVEVHDPVTLVFKLKPNLVYQNLAPVNGRKVLTSDIVAYQEYVAGLANAANASFQRTFLDRAEAPDDRTLIYRLKKPNAYVFASTQLCSNTGQLIVPKEMLPNLDTATPVGSGPYQLADYTFGVRYLSKRFDKYRGTAEGKPYIDESEQIAMADAVALEAALRAGQISMWDVPVSAVDRLKREVDPSQLVMESSLAVSVDGFAMNNNPAKGKKPWNDIRVREAVYKTINRQQFLDLVWNGKGVLPAGPLHASLLPYQLEKKDTEQYYKQDLAAAKQLLSAAAFDTSKEYEIIGRNSDPAVGQAGEVLSTQLAQIGFKTRVTMLPFAEWLPKRVAPGDFDITVGGNPGGDTPSRAIRYHHSDTQDQYNNVGLYDPTIDDLIEKSEATIDRESNIKQVKQIQMEVLKRFSPSYVTATVYVYIFRSARLQDFEMDVVDGQQYRTNTWYKS
jgi:peptide/nickel transport system substrate-binding protein